MLLSFDEALLILKKWKDETSRIALMAAWDNIAAAYLIGRVLNIEGSTVLLDLSGESVFIFDMVQCAMQYGEPRLLPERLTAKMGGIERSLYVRLPSGIDFFICELKSATSS